VGAITDVVLAHRSLRPSCDLTMLDSRPSPAGRYIASVFQKDCGAIIDYATEVAPRPADQAFAEESANVVLIVKSAVLVHLAWATDDEIHIKTAAICPDISPNRQLEPDQYFNRPMTKAQCPVMAQGGQ